MLNLRLIYVQHLPFYELPVSSVDLTVTCLLEKDHFLKVREIF